MAVFATTAWARRAGLTTTGRDWEIRCHLLANGKHPTGVSNSLRATELFVILGRDRYWIDIQHGGKRSDWAHHRSGESQRHWTELDLDVPYLASFRPWVAAAETEFGKKFRRDKLWVQSNIKGGRDAVVSWIDNDFGWD